MVLCALNYAISCKGNFKMCVAILITHPLFSLFTLLASLKKNTDCRVLFLSSTKPGSHYFFNYSVYLFVYTAPLVQGFSFFLQKCQQNFLPDTYILCKLQLNTLLNSKHLSYVLACCVCERQHTIVRRYQVWAWIR